MALLPPEKAQLRVQSPHIFGVLTWTLGYYIVQLAAR
jgi:hypothetical protein